MPATLAQKLKIRAGFTLRTLNAPADFESQLGGLPEEVTVSATARRYDQLHWFVRDRAQLERDLEKVLGLLKETVVGWIYYPKGSSKIQTDLTRDRGWEALMAQEDMHWISLISFNDTWSAFGMRRKTAADLKKDGRPKPERAIFNYIDAKARTIRLPEDLAAALKKTPAAKTFFDTLSFSNRKEYVGWIVSAKRDDTRARRVEETLERLGKEWSNPNRR